MLNTTVQDFINNHLKSDLTKLVLKGSPFEGIQVQELAEQILSKSKCREKLPTWFNASRILYPPVVSIEQSSSEETAAYKSRLIQGQNLIDLTGGFGVDSYYFSKVFAEVVYCELDPGLSELAAHNFNVLGADNIQCQNTDGISYLSKHRSHYDWIFADPSRRNQNRGKVFQLEHCLPDLTEHLELLMAHGKQVMVKLSPILDISDTIEKLKYVEQAHVIAVKNEVKELLFILGRHSQIPCDLYAANLIESGRQIVKSRFGTSVSATFSLPKKYLYEPNSAILKAGIFNEVSRKFTIDKLHNNSHLYTSNDLIEFPGRRFEISSVLKYRKKDIMKELPDGKANITTRNFPETVALIRKKTGIKEGGEHYLFFTTNAKEKHIVILCKKV